MDQIAEDDNGMANIDLMFAFVIVVSAVMMAIQIMPELSHEDRSGRIEQYMTAARASDNLVQDTGSPSNWELEWNNNYSNVSKIGFLYVENNRAMQKVLNIEKINALMKDPYIDGEVKWWEFPNSTTSQKEKENASRALGLSGYNFYMQVHPVGVENVTLFNSTLLEIKLHDQKGINFDTVTVVDRYTYIADPSKPQNIKYLNFTTQAYRSASGCVNASDICAIHYRLNLWVW